MFHSVHEAEVWLWIYQPKAYVEARFLTPTRIKYINHLMPIIV